MEWHQLVPILELISCQQQYLHSAATGILAPTGHRTKLLHKYAVNYYADSQTGSAKKKEKETILKNKTKSLCLQVPDLQTLTTLKHREHKCS